MDLLTDPNTLDLVLDGYQLAQDDTIQTAVLLSLWSDARDGGERGFWAESLLQTGDSFGSRLWTLRKHGLSTERVEMARQYALEALAWLVADGYATSVEVLATRLDQGVLLTISIAGHLVTGEKMEVTL